MSTMQAVVDAVKGQRTKKDHVESILRESEVGSYDELRAAISKAVGAMDELIADGWKYDWSCICDEMNKVCCAAGAYQREYGGEWRGKVSTISHAACLAVGQRDWHNWPKTRARLVELWDL